MHIYRTSSSRISSAYTCQLKLTLDYFIRVGRRHTDSSVRGHILHTEFKNFEQDNFESPETFRRRGMMDFYNYVDKCDSENTPVIFRRPESIPGTISRINDTLPLFYEENIGKKEPNPQVEVSFRPMIRIGNTYGQVIVKIDKMYHENDELIVRDYKTGDPTSKTDTNDPLSTHFLQLPLYSMIIEKLFKLRPIIELHYPADGRHKTVVQRFQINPEDYKRVNELIARAYEIERSISKRIFQGVKSEPNYGPHCFAVCQHAYTGDCDRYTGNNRFKDLKPVKMTRMNNHSFEDVTQPKPKKKPRKKKLLEKEGQERFHFGRWAK